jgi:hypothetical protein
LRYKLTQPGGYAILASEFDHGVHDYFWNLPALSLLISNLAATVFSLVLGFFGHQASNDVRLRARHGEARAGQGVVGTSSRFGYSLLDTLWHDTARG